MTPEQNLVFQSLSRGRLIFPFRAEMKSLRAVAARRELIDAESERLAELEDGLKAMVVKDEWFHSAMEGGDVDTAARVAGEALKICEDLA